MTGTTTAPDAAAGVVAAALVDEALAVMMSDREQATALARRALAQARSQGDTAGECLASLVLVQMGLRQTDFSAVVPEAQRVLALGSGHAAPRVRDIAQHVRALLLRRQGDQAGAMALWTELHARAHERPPLDAYFTVSMLAIVQSMAGDHAEALRGFYAALELASRCGHLGVEVNALNNAGSHQLDLYNLEDARPMLERCLEGALRLGSRRQIIFAAGNLLQCLCAMGEGPGALALARQHLIPLIRPDDDPLLHRDEEIAQALIACGLWEEARGYLRRTPQIDLQTNEVSACRAWLQARLMMTDGQPRQALAHCQAQQARQAADDEDSNMPLDVLRLAELAATAAAACGEHAEAYRQMALAYATQDRLLGRASRARFVSLQIQHEVQRAVQERDAALQAARQMAELNATLQAQIEANRSLTSRLEEQALRDALTGLHNRRHLFEAGPALLSQARRQGQHAVVAMIDIDHFKQINDRHGHDGGDEVLKSFAALLRAATRASDLCCRYGGEEFVLLMLASDPQAALRRVQGLLERCTAEPVQVPGGQAVACSFSAGVGSAPDGARALADLLRHADAALYEAKRQGRNRVVADLG